MNPKTKKPQSFTNSFILFVHIEFDVYLKSKLAEVQQRNLENKLRSAEFYAARNAYDVGSKASVYWTPPTALDGDSEFGSPAIRSAAPCRDVDSGLQMSPIHINYINENLDTMIGLKPVIRTSKFLDEDDDDDDAAYGYRLPPHLDRLRMYLCPERLVGGDGSLADESGPSGLQQNGGNSAESISNNVDGSQQKNGSNEDNNWCSCGVHATELDDDDDDDEQAGAAAGIKVTLRQFSTPNERESLLVASGGGLKHSASCQLGASVSTAFGGSRSVTTKRFGNEYYHSVGDVVGDEDLLNNFNHHNNHAIVLPTHKPSSSSSSASKSPSCRCCPHTVSIPSATTTASSVIEHHPLQNQTPRDMNDVNISETNDLLMGGGSGTTNETGSVGRALTGGDKLNIILDETGKPMLVNQCDNRLLLLQTSASLPEMQSMRSMVTNGGAPQTMMPQVQHHTTVEVHDGRHDVVLALDGGDSDCADSGCKGIGLSVGCLPKTSGGRHEDTNV